jgi:hypothetical protein
MSENSNIPLAMKCKKKTFLMWNACLDMSFCFEQKNIIFHSNDDGDEDHHDDCCTLHCLVYKWIKWKIDKIA